MKGKWKIEDDGYVLSLEDSNGNSSVPVAEDIFMAEYNNMYRIENMDVTKPSKEIANLSISKYPIDIKVIISLNSNEDDVFIKADFGAKVNINIIPIKFRNDKFVDHIIIDHTWYPFVPGEYEELINILNKIGIYKDGRITIRQYLELKKSAGPFIIDNISNIPINKGGLLSKNKLSTSHIKAVLYPYQNQGVRWMNMIVEEESGCILADEMGLGKTLQIIVILSLYKYKGTSLVVAPVSLLENWKREINRFAPDLSVLVHQGNERTGFYKELEQFDVVVTSYETVYRDLSIFKMAKWNIIVADEAQMIKNPEAKRTIALKQLDKNAAVAVTGTPIENRLLDLWSIADFAFSGYLGSLEDFNRVYSNDRDSAVEIEPIVSPILLRRRVKDVAADLPEKINIPQSLKLSSNEANLYEQVRQNILKEYTGNPSLISLIKLRMYCTHPSLILNDYSNDPSTFTKYMRLIEVLEEILHNNEKVIIFTSFSKMSDIMVDDLRKRFEIYCNNIDGRVDVASRQLIIDEFSNQKGSAILVLNPRAAGAGLNITAANHVIHYNLEWNPAIEDQASARAYRRGQSRPVTIHRLYFSDTVEEAINDRLDRKREISNAAIIGTDGSDEDSRYILAALYKSPLNIRSDI